jgi:hypothetical protein
MSFNILDCLEKLGEYGDVTDRGTWISAKCPICNGILKISKSSKYGSYACYTNECHRQNPNPIRQLLYIRNSFNRRTSFDYYKPLISLEEIVEPLYFTGTSSELLSTVPYIEPIKVEGENKRYTYYDYGEFRVVRLDVYLDNPEKTKKYIYPEYFNKTTQEFIKGTPDFTSLPIYLAKYLQPTVVFVEGEKCADIAHKLGIAAITFPTSLSDIYLPRVMRQLYLSGIRNVLFLPDNDVIGFNKVSKLEKHCWKNNICTKRYYLTDSFTEFSNEDGFDLYDAVDRKLISAENLSRYLDVFLR